MRELRSVMKCFPDGYSRAFPDLSTRCGPAINKYTENDRKLSQETEPMVDNGYPFINLKASPTMIRQCTEQNMKSFPQSPRT